MKWTLNIAAVSVIVGRSGAVLSDPNKVADALHKMFMDAVSNEANYRGRVPAICVTAFNHEEHEEEEKPPSKYLVSAQGCIKKSRGICSAKECPDPLHFVMEINVAATPAAYEIVGLEVDVSTKTKENIDKWIVREKLNEYGDKKNTMYLGGTPIFDEARGKSISKYDYIVQKHYPQQPWAPLTFGEKWRQFFSFSRWFGKKNLKTSE